MDNITTNIIGLDRPLETVQLDDTTDVLALAEVIDAPLAGMGEAICLDAQGLDPIMHCESHA